MILDEGVGEFGGDFREVLEEDGEDLGEGAESRVIRPCVVIREGNGLGPAGSGCVSLFYFRNTVHIW